jgi:hypothetical protein
MNTQKFFIFAIAILTTLTGACAQESISFKLSNHKGDANSSKISISTTDALGVKKITVSAQNQTVLSLYQGAYNLTEANFLFPESLNYIKSENKKFDLDFSGTSEILIAKLDSSFNLKTEKVTVDSISLLITHIGSKKTIKPVKLFSKWQFTTTSTDEITEIQGQMTAKEIANFISKELRMPVELSEKLEGKIYELNFSFSKRSSLDEQIAKYKNIGIYIEKKTKTSEYIQILRQH